MEKEILTALVEMVKSGGQMAIYGIAVYWGMTILKLAVHGGLIWICLRLICTTVIKAWELRLDKRASDITLLSSEACKDFTKALDTLSKENLAILKDIELRLTALKTPLNTTEEKK